VKNVVVGDQKRVSVANCLVTKVLWRLKDISITTRFTTTKIASFFIAHKLAPSNQNGLRPRLT
jgi:hypothetical protein